MQLAGVYVCVFTTFARKALVPNFSLFPFAPDHFISGYYGSAVLSRVGSQGKGFKKNLNLLTVRVSREMEPLGQVSSRCTRTN